MERFKKTNVLFFVLFLQGFFVMLYADQLPYRKELSTDIKFWKKVFTETSTDQYIIHDSQYLNIIYTIINFDSTASERKRSRYLRSIKEKYEQFLLRMHYSKQDTSDLYGWERRVFNQFKSIDEKDKFRTAAQRIRAQQGIKEKFIKGIKRSFSYLQSMEEIFKRYNLPRELIYMPHIESSFNINAASRAGAKGMWQFMWGTGRYYLRINRIVDQRFDPIYSTEAAAKLLQRNYKELQDWALAITAYNHGLAGMKRAQKKFNGDYLEIRDGYLKRSFGFASKNFYPEFLAVVDIMDSLQFYFPQIGRDPIYVFKEIEPEKQINLPQLAKDLHFTIEELQRLNPSFKKVIWKGQRSLNKGYKIRLPIKVDLENVIAYVGLESVPPKSPVKNDLDRDENITNYNIPVFSFSKVTVEQGEQQPTISQDLFSAIESNIDVEMNATDLISFNKPGVENNFTNDNTLKRIDDIFQNDSNQGEFNSNFLAVSLYKPQVSLDEDVTSEYGFDFENEKVSMSSPKEIPSTNDIDLKAKENNDDKDSGYAQVSHTNNLTMDEIHNILMKRLRIKNNEIIIFPNETLGHIAEWLSLRASYLRSLNNLHYGQKIYSGQTLRVDFTYISTDEFSTKRLKYHMNLIQKMLDGKLELRLVDYKVNPGENLWNISRKRNNFPVNLLLYFNDLNKLGQLYPGDIIKLPMI